MSAFDALEEGASFALVSSGRFMPEINHGVLAAHDGFQDGLIFGHESVERGADEANVFAQLGPVAVSKGVS